MNDGVNQNIVAIILVQDDMAAVDVPPYSGTDIGNGCSHARVAGEQMKNILQFAEILPSLAFAKPLHSKDKNLLQAGIGTRRESDSIHAKCRGLW